MYAIAFDVEGKVAISGRFRPADDRSMLVDHFAHVLPADIGPINNAKTWEVSRAFSIDYGQRHHNLIPRPRPFLTTSKLPLPHARTGGWWFLVFGCRTSFVPHRRGWSVPT